MIRRHIHWIIAVLLVTFVVGACVVRSRPPARGRPVYVKPVKHHDHDHDKHKHKKHHDKHRH
jgi:hypothetical protein